MADLKISQLNPLDGTLLAPADELAIVDSSASETKKIGADELVEGGIRLLPDNSIPWDKIDDSGLTVGDNSVGENQIIDGSITTDKLADGAVTDDKITGPIGLDKLPDAGPNLVLAGPADPLAAQTSPTYRPLVSGDLPIATAAEVGGVSILTGTGLDISVDGALGLSVTTTAGESAVVSYDQHGRIYDGRDLAPGDLPIATTSTLGVVQVGDGLGITAAGVLNADLTAGEIPDLDASKITSGEFPTERLADRSVTRDKLAHYATAYIQEATPTTDPVDHPVGELWFQETTARLSMWNGNSWMTIGQGALSSENLRFCGLFDATTSLVTAVTQFGTTDGFVVGNGIPNANNQLTGTYLVCDTPGSSVSHLPGVVFDAGDWIVCLGEARGWERIDTLNGGGGGGGSTTLGGLVDVTLTNAQVGDVLYYNGSMWVNEANDPGTYS